jgi:hypothetical protein
MAAKSTREKRGMAAKGAKSAKVVIRTGGGIFVCDL